MLDLLDGYDRQDASAPILSLRGIRKEFPGVKALDGVDLTIRAGEVHALMGGNGAGKSTLIKVLTGVYRRDAGEITIDGAPIAPGSPLEAQALGISTVFQEVNLVPALSVAENLFIGREPRRWGLIDWPRIRREAERALARLELDLDVRRPLGDHSIAIQQMVAIARALDLDARVLILDEPTSSLDADEVAQLFAALRRLRAQGLGLVFVSHFLDQVYALSDRITVLRNGRSVGEGLVGDLPRREMVALMLGRDLAERGGARPRPLAAATSAAPLLAATGLGRRGSLAPTDLEVRAGEVVGLGGLLGSGRSELARLLFGIDRADSGALAVDGARVRLGGPRAAIALGLGFCPEDRKVEAIIPDLSVRENIVLALQARRGWLRRIGAAEQRALAERYIALLGIRTPDAEKAIRLLSGGNQQKAILARWLAAQPRLLILDEPTRGIDVGAKAEIEKVVGELCGKGMAILFISSELEEVARTSHRVVVLRDRQRVGELAGDAVTVDAILELIARHD